MLPNRTGGPTLAELPLKSQFTIMSLTFGSLEGKIKAVPIAFSRQATGTFGMFYVYNWLQRARKPPVK